MSNLVNLEINYKSEEPKVSGRDLYEELQIQTPYSMWIKRMFEYGFVENKDYWTDNKKVTRQDGAIMPQTQIDHYLTLDMAKEIAMIQRNEIGKKIRQYLIEVERQWNSPESIMSRALMLANKTLEKIKNQNLILLKENEEMKPKAEFYDIAINSESLLDMSQIAKLINIKGMGRNNLIKYLRFKKILMVTARPYQKYVEQGLFKLVEVTKPSVKGNILFTKACATQKGLEYIIKILKEDGYEPRFESDYNKDWKDNLTSKIIKKRENNFVNLFDDSFKKERKD